jgi:hypothetical protein
MLSLTQLNNQYETNLITSLSVLGHLCPNDNYYNATNALGCYSVTDNVKFVIHNISKLA